MILGLTILDSDILAVMFVEENRVYPLTPGCYPVAPDYFYSATRIDLGNNKTLKIKFSQPFPFASCLLPSAFCLLPSFISFCLTS